MKIVILSPNNYYGVPGALAQYLRAHCSLEAHSYCYTDPVYPNVDFVLPQLSPSEIGHHFQKITDADIIHVFDQSFTAGNNNLDNCLRSNNALFTYTPDYLSQNYGNIFFKHYRSDIIATTWGPTAMLRWCPVAFTHMPPAFPAWDLTRADKKIGSPPVVGVASHFGDRSYLDALLNALHSIQERIEFDLKVMEGLNPYEASQEISRCDLYIDHLKYNGLSPLGMQAISLGVAVATNLTALDLTVMDLPPVAPITIKTCEKALEELLRDPDRLKTLGSNGVIWAQAKLDPQKVSLMWQTLYLHIANNAASIESAPSLP